jgi:hypothetical protein
MNDKAGSSTVGVGRLVKPCARMLAGGLALSAAILCGPRSADAVEGAAGFYLLGSKGSMAGFTPPPGTYVLDTKFYYSGDIGLTLLNDALLANVKAQAYYDAPSVLWVAPRKVLGGNVGFGVIVPVGWKDVRASAELNLPPPLGVTVNADIRSDDTAFGDPVGLAMIGWHAGNWHWNLSTLLNVPVGFWQRGNPTNIGFNRWAVDTSLGVTWLDQKRGLEISGTGGVTFNFDENQATSYRSGDEFHFEFAILQSLSKQFAVGVTGYRYRQITGDGGSGARLGSFEGRATGIGPIINYNFVWRQTPVSTSLRWIHEFDAENRTEGDAGILNISLPLSGLLH